MKEIVFFSHNKYKIDEVTKILQNNKIRILTLNDLPDINKPKETGKTFKENAMIKSTFGFKSFGLPCFADDSGICIGALDNQPGIKSKRFQIENGGLKKTFNMIINQTKIKKNYKAFFQTSVALTIDNKNSEYFDGIIYGKISSKPLGSRGFHYDPIFIPSGANKTFAQMLDKEKNKISHRAIAMKKLKNFILNLID